ncbi:MAG: cytochrome ubiquinol oxidase subunit I [Ktedonobacterales bacterium]|nr:cytochrome ubiquinol oxidase subunit I [Ktedonobacterales bacterium]
MQALDLARWQFAITTVYHFFFVPLTLGLALLVAIMETIYVRTGDESYKRMTQFWGKLFVINFAMGVVTGIVQEFQFGMNWSTYSRFVGDIFGAPLAIEALLAFYLESTFIGLWIFGWDKLPKRTHLATIWVVAIGSNISALWILIANSFMQEPVGFVIRNGRAQMTNFFALLTNPNLLVQFPHVFFSGVLTGSFFVLGISAYHLARKRTTDTTLFRRSLKLGMVTALVAGIMVALVGHTQGQHMVATQPMKMAAAEALYNSEDPASFSLFTIGNPSGSQEVFSIRVPDLLSLLAFNSFSGKVQGINDLQAQYVKQYGPGNYIPPVPLIYWTFRIMVGTGVLMILLALWGMIGVMRKRIETQRRFLWLLVPAIALPFIANSSGWLMTELGRQPWIVNGLLKTSDAVSPTVNAGMVLFSLIAFTLIYGALMAVDVFLMVRFAKVAPVAEADAENNGQIAPESAVAEVY